MIGDEIDWSWFDEIDWSDNPLLDSPKTASRRSRGRPRTRSPPPFEVPPRLVERMRRAGPGNITEEQCKQDAEEARREAIGWAMFRASKGGRNTANNNRQKEKRRRILRLYRENADLILDYSLSIMKVTDIILGERDSLGLAERSLWNAIAEIRNQDRKWTPWRARRARKAR